jgi:hypothetical protein
MKKDDDDIEVTENDAVSLAMAIIVLAILGFIIF